MVFFMKSGWYFYWNRIFKCYMVFLNINYLWYPNVFPKFLWPRWVHYPHIARSININVIPTFGRIIQVAENQKQSTVLHLWLRFPKLKAGNTEKEPWIKDQLILIPTDMFPSAPEKWLRNQSHPNIFTNTLKNPDLAED